MQIKKVMSKNHINEMLLLKERQNKNKERNEIDRQTQHPKEMKDVDVEQRQRNVNDCGRCRRRKCSRSPNITQIKKIMESKRWNHSGFNTPFTHHLHFVSSKRKIYLLVQLCFYYKHVTMLRVMYITFDHPNSIDNYFIWSTLLRNICLYLSDFGLSNKFAHDMSV